jgi:type II secretory pathway pseudopilin PulG
MKTSTIRQRKPAEEGYMLVVVIFILAILMLSLTVAAPVVKKEIQRDREVEMMHRGKQYARAVKLYYKKFGAYPPNMDALVKTNDVRFLRKKYVDMTTGKEEWKIIRVGQQKTPTTGFFGQPLGAAGATASPVAGATPIGGASLGGPGSPGAGSSMFGSTSSGPGTPPAPGDSTGGADATNPMSSSAGSPFASGLSGQSFGGMPIMGFSPNSPKESILVYKKKNHYNEWEFLYDPRSDLMTMGGNQGNIGQPIGGSTTPVGGGGIGSGFTINGSSGSNGIFGGSNPGGSSPPTPPTSPTP